MWKISNFSVTQILYEISFLNRLAENTIGYIDWNSYIPTFMTRIMRAFELPVYYKQIPPAKKFTLDMTSMVRWVVSVMNGHPAIFDQLEQMFNALESYYHTANFGAHSLKLCEFLLKLVQQFVTKIYKERYSKKVHWGTQISEDKKITDEEITRFVKIVMPVVLHGMYFRANLDVYGKILQNLAFLRPELVIPPVLERLFTAFDTLTEPHKLTANMLFVVSMARSIVHPGPHCKGKGKRKNFYVHFSSKVLYCKKESILIEFIFEP